MLKAIAILIVAVGALVGPTTAQATVQLTQGETALPVGAFVTGTSTNFVTTLESGGQLRCKNVTLHLELDANGPEHIVLEQLGAATTSGCTFVNVFEVPAEVTDWTIGSEEEAMVTLGTNGTGSAGLEFRYHVDFLELSCAQSGNTHLQATPGTDFLDLGPSKLTATGPGCRAGTIEGRFSLTSNGSPIVIDAV